MFLDFSLLAVLSTLSSTYSSCPVSEPGMRSDCDIGCVGDRFAGVISDGEKNSSVSLYLTPSLRHQPLMNERYWSGECCSFIFLKGSYLFPQVFCSSRCFEKPINTATWRQRECFRCSGFWKIWTLLQIITVNSTKLPHLTFLKQNIVLLRIHLHQYKANTGIVMSKNR